MSDDNQDREVTEEEVRVTLELKLKELKALARRRIAWAAFGSTMLYTGALFLPWLDAERVQMLVGLSPTFYLGNLGIVASYMGADVLGAG